MNKYRKCVDIEDALKKIGWKTETSFSGCEGSNSFYITISKEIGEDRCVDGKWIFADPFEKKIRFSDHELPAYYPLADYECRFDLNGSSWSNLKPKLKKLFKETV